MEETKGFWRLFLVIATLSLAGLSSVSRAATTILNETFENYPEGSNLLGQGGWIGAPQFCVGAECTQFLARGLGLLSRSSNGTINPNTARYGVLRNILVPCGLATNQVYTVTFDAFARSSGPPTHNAGVVLCEKDPRTNQWVGWRAKVFNGPPRWCFEVNMLGVTQCFDGGYDRPIHMTIVVDPVVGQAYGRADFGSGPVETIHRALTAGQINQFDAVAIAQDYQNPGTYLGAEFDNVKVTTVFVAPLPLGSPTLSEQASGNDLVLTWSAVAGAIGYDVVRGNLQTLHTLHGNFTDAVDSCPANNVAATSILVSGSPGPGDGFFYLVRGANCLGPGTYDCGAPSQVGSRDVSINGSEAACP